jgi:hypothetical protein
MRYTANQPKRTMVDPREYTAIIGQTFVKREYAPLLVIGKHAWTRYSLGRLGVPHPVAASSLNRVCQELRITTLPALAENARQLGAFKGLGVTAYWTVLAILREAGYDVEEIHGEDVTYDTLKMRAKRDQQRRQPRLRKARRAGPPSESADLAAEIS